MKRQFSNYKLGFISCSMCGVLVARTGTAQKRCTACSRVVVELSSPGYQSKYRELHREELLERGRAEKNSPKRTEQKRLAMSRWRERHRVEHRERQKSFRKANMEYVKFMNSTRREQERAAGKHTYKEWLALKEKFGFACASCGRKEPEIKLTRDHIVPLSRGGTNDIGNIQPLCGSCNSRKWARTVNYATIHSG